MKITKDVYCGYMQTADVIADQNDVTKFTKVEKTFGTLSINDEQLADFAGHNIRIEITILEDLGLDTNATRYEYLHKHIKEVEKKKSKRKIKND